MFENLCSDINLTMAATQAFEGILSQVVSSNLNFRLEQSPFSAVIHLKKSVIRNQNGNLRFPPPSLSVQLLLQVQSDNYQQVQKIIQLENALQSLRIDSEKSTQTAIKDLEDKLKQEKFQVEEQKVENAALTKYIND
jgi:hypothetical protein